MEGYEEGQVDEIVPFSGSAQVEFRILLTCCCYHVMRHLLEASSQTWQTFAGVNDKCEQRRRGKERIEEAEGTAGREAVRLKVLALLPEKIGQQEVAKSHGREYCQVLRRARATGGNAKPGHSENGEQVESWSRGGSEDEPKPPLRPVSAETRTGRPRDGLASSDSGCPADCFQRKLFRIPVILGSKLQVQRLQNQARMGVQEVVAAPKLVHTMWRQRRAVLRLSAWAFQLPWSQQPGCW